jgi:hypothetical protein
MYAHCTLNSLRTRLTPDQVISLSGELILRVRACTPVSIKNTLT